MPLAAWPLTLLCNVCAAFFILGVRTVAIFLSDPFGKDLIDFDLEPLMRAAYDEAVAQLRMRPYQPTLDTLPAAPTGPAGVLVDPTVLTSKERSAWVAAELTSVADATKGIAKLSKGVTQSNVWALKSENTRRLSGPRRLLSGRSVKATSTAAWAGAPSSPAARVAPAQRPPAAAAPATAWG